MRGLFVLGLLVLSSCTLLPGELIEMERGEIVHVADADTYKIRTDAGKVIDVRLLGIDFPDLDNARITYWTNRSFAEERVRECYARGNDFVKQKFLHANVVLYADSREDNNDKYGRRLRYVFVEDESTSINELLVHDGWAVMRDWNYPECTLCETFGLLEEIARSKGRGCLWGN